MPEPSVFEVELAIEKLKSHKSPGVDQIPAKLIKAGVEKFAMSSINLLLLFGIERNFLRIGRNRLLYLSIRNAVKQTAVIIGACHFAKYVQNFIQNSAVKVNSIFRGSH